ncbi:DUF2199 domain-containing protein [Tropicibacter sp. R15_0]|uniref:DUF2199 domain-containing protein n=1 Tax=Tropicibacter sp. R15_0 TaxID=2821101 RepID=UPI001ADAED20|nr:DUF2199 domain-containing protein [Tropicibacter sp. R15_0]MBO9464964.1 DUF2199 domain-containing protein [Tropicibacter sp. R15_0]
MALLALDSRWRRLHSPPFDGIFDIGFEEPEDWPHAAFEGGEDLIVGEDRLNHDLCRLDGRYFLRAVLYLPVRGSDDSVGFGLWAEVSETLFRAFLAAWSGDAQDIEPGEGLIANTPPGFEEELGTLCQVAPGPEDQRPRLHAIDGPLAEAQENGISFDDLLNIYAAAGNDIRPKLAQD